MTAANGPGIGKAYTLEGGPNASNYYGGGYGAKTGQPGSPTGSPPHKKHQMEATGSG